MRKATLLELIVIFALVLVFGICIIGIMDKIWSKDMQRIVFGYVQIQKSELLVRESEAYKAVYCGLCRQMGKDYSVFTRFTLSYDCTFYAMLLMSLNRSCKGFKDGRCTCNPLKKCKFATDSGDAYRKAAAFSMISVYYKIIDDIQDSGFFKKLLCRIIKPFFSHQRKKAADKYPDMDKAVSDMMKMQYDAEHSEKPSVDMSAHPTALMLAAVLSAEAQDRKSTRLNSSHKVQSRMPSSA